jgi:hypothetical protein
VSSTFARASRCAALLALLGALAALLAGCGAGAGKAPAETRLTVTQDFGARTQRDLAAPKVSGSETVMRLLQRNAKVTTRFGGGFVQSIDGAAGGRRDGWRWLLRRGRLGTGADRGRHGRLTVDAAAAERSPMCQAPVTSRAKASKTST